MRPTISSIMKTAIYIRDGTTQLVLTPDSEWEKNVLRAIDRESKQAMILRGSFYDCQGGWIRERSNDDESLIIRLDSTQPNLPGPPEVH